MWSEPHGIEEPLTGSNDFNIEFNYFLNLKNHIFPDISHILIVSIGIFLD